MSFDVGAERLDVRERGVEAPEVDVVVGGERAVARIGVVHPAREADVVGVGGVVVEAELDDRLAARRRVDRHLREQVGLLESLVPRAVALAVERLDDVARAAEVVVVA